MCTLIDSVCILSTFAKSYIGTPENIGRVKAFNPARGYHISFGNLEVKLHCNLTDVEVGDAVEFKTAGEYYCLVKIQTV